MSRKSQTPQILALVDFENIMLSVMDVSALRFSIEDGFKKIIDTITREIGNFMGIWAFLPPDRATVQGASLYHQNINIIACPRIRNKKSGLEEDTTDERLKDVGKWMINNVRDATHLCIFSGDQDFRLLIQEAKQKGLKIIIVAPNPRSLSLELIKLASIGPNGRKMVYFFSPVEEAVTH